jgi:ring-1,2-phenylacetyl-CoA epoxidase subunit PaaC
MHMKHKEYYLIVADTLLILGQRLSEWCGHGPAIEEDIALSNVALDYIGQATALYKEVSEKSGEGKSEDDYAFLRDAWEFKNLLLVELPKGDYGYTIVRQFLFSTWYYHFLEALHNSQDEFLKGFAAKSIKEVKYHFQHSRDWMLRLGAGTEESHARMQNALNEIWQFTGEMFVNSPAETAAIADGVGVNNPELLDTWRRIVSAVVQEAELTLPEDAWMQKGGKEGKHSEHIGFVLAEMQFLQRAYPGSKW